MKVRILGSGEAFDAEYGNNSCLVYGDAPAAPVVLLDCGYQIPERLWRLGELYPRLHAVWITHTHADHAFGLVPLLTRFWEEKRQQPLTIFGPAGITSYVERIMELGYPGMIRKLPYPLDFKELKSGEEAQFNELTFRCAASVHSVTNLSVRITSTDGHSLAVSGDGNLSDETRALYQGVDLLLHEAFSPGPGIPVHSSVEELKAYLAVPGTEIGALGITHISHSFRNEVVSRVKELARADSRWFVAEPGMVIEIK